MMKLTMIEQLFNKADSIMLPFLFTVNGENFTCTEVLRFLPEKRVVIRAKNKDEQQFVIKLFVKNKKGKKELELEKQGYGFLKEILVKTPSLEFTIENEADCYGISYDYLANSTNFSDKADELDKYVKQLIELVANLHDSGIYQSDFHLENILIVDNALFLIDLASIIASTETKQLKKAKSLANFAMLVAQFKDEQQLILIDELPYYYQLRGWEFNNNELKQCKVEIKQVWNKRKTNYLSKCFRKCTMTAYKKTLSHEYAFKSLFFKQNGSDFIHNIELLISTGKILKDGNSATVVLVEYFGKKIVIKRYNIKGFWHFMKRCFRPSRAAVSWRNANLLELIGLTTASPLGFIENRVVGLRSTAYFISDYAPAEELLDVYQKKMPSEDELKQIKTIFLLLKDYQISHGDLKAQNLLLDKQGSVLLIDLDAMQEHSHRSSFQGAIERDKARFLRNWQDPKVKDLFIKCIYSA